MNAPQPRRSFATTLHNILFPFSDGTARGCDLTHVQVVQTLYAVFGLLVVACLAGCGKWWGAIMAGLGMLATGTVVGFLFGVPKVRQAGAPRRGPSNDPAADRAADPTRTGSKLLDDPAGPSYEQSVNTNLEDVSDWLTKILIGVGLVEARTIALAVGPELSAAAANLDIQGGTTVVGGAAVYFLVTGFFYGYLITRLYFASAFQRADSEALGLTEGRANAVPSPDTIGSSSPPTEVPAKPTE